MEKIYSSKNFPFKEFTVSSDYPELAKQITLTDLDKFKIYSLSAILEYARRLVDAPVYILSSKRSDILNEKVGGSNASDHLFKGNTAAVDFTVREASEYYLWVLFNSIPAYFPQSYGQLIIYFKDNDIEKPNFLHLSLPTKKHTIERLVKLNGKFHKLSEISEDNMKLKSLIV